jgi:very-short-patch-repair endonuclease
VSENPQARQALRALARLQDGVVSREQVIGHGLSLRAAERLLRDGSWQRLHRGVFLTSEIPPSWPALAWAGVLIGGDHARLGGSSSGYLHGLVPQPPENVTILIPHALRLVSTSPWDFVRERSGSHDTRSVGGPPRLTVEDTVLDLCAHGAASDVVGWVTAAVQRRLTTPRRLSTALGQRPRQRHRDLILGLIADVDDGAESPLEVQYLRKVERPHGLPVGTRQQSIRGLIGVRDVLYRKYGVIVELDGRIGHGELGRFRDMWRDNASSIEDWITLRYGHTNLVRDPCAVAEQVGQALNRRGWPGLATRCRHCSNVV